LELSVGKEFYLGADQKPALFLFDIQDEQVENLKAFLKAEQAPLRALSPMVRARLMKVNREEFKADDLEKMFTTREEENESRFRQRMMNLSWAEDLNESETLIDGLRFRDTKLGEEEYAISLEKRFAQRLKLKLGDRLEFDVLGVPVVGRVVNVRSVKWTSFRPNFFITFAPGALEEAPKTWLASVGQMPEKQKIQLQNRLQKKFSNISAVDVTQLVQRLLELFSRLKLALQFMAYLTVLVGVVVLLSLAQDQLNRRIGEVMLEKTLGFSPWRVMRMILLEFIVVAFSAFALGALGGALIAAAMSTFVFEGEQVWDISFMASLTLSGVLLVSLPLLFMARKVYIWRPAGLLQNP
jgi:putative ABC transport system permease protein